MDFKRIQVLLFLFFVIFDIYLFSVLSSKFMQSQWTETNSPLTIEQRLSERNIKFGDTLTTEKFTLPIVKADGDNLLLEQMSQLKNQEVSMTNQQLVATFEQPIALPFVMTADTQALSESDVAKLKEQVLANQTWFIEGQAYDQFMLNMAERVIIARMYATDQVAIVDGTAELVLNLDEHFQIVGYKQTYQQHFSTLDQPLQLITSRDAIGLLEQKIETYIPDGANITQVNLKYYRSMDLDHFDIYSPAWHIMYTVNGGGSHSVLVDAIRSTVLSQININ